MSPYLDRERCSSAGDLLVVGPTAAEGPIYDTGLSTTLPASEPEVMLEVHATVRASQEHAGQGRRDPSANGGQARRGWRAGLGRGPSPFSPRAAGAAGRRKRAGKAARGGAGRARSAPRNGRAPARP